MTAEESARSGCRPSRGATLFLLAAAAALGACVWSVYLEEGRHMRARKRLRAGVSLKSGVLNTPAEDRRFGLRVWTTPALDPPLELALEVTGDRARLRGAGPEAGFQPLPEALDALVAQLAPVASGAKIEAEAHWLLSHDRHVNLRMELSPTGKITRVRGR